MSNAESFSSSLLTLIMAPCLYAPRMTCLKFVLVSGIASPSSIQLASMVSLATGILRVPELVRMTCAI